MAWSFIVIEAAAVTLRLHIVILNEVKDLAVLQRESGTFVQPDTAFRRMHSRHCTT
jgi:hypothetical protein